MAISKPKEFLSSIINTKSMVAIVAKTKTERDYLEQQYNSIASLKNGFTVYRNYLKAYIAPDKKIGRKLLLKTLLEILCLSPQQQTVFNKAKSTDIKQNKSNLRELYDTKAYLEIAVNLLDATSYLDNILGLCALTGRRAAEIGASAEFKYIDNSNVEFSGQLKTKERIDVAPYQIPVLFNAAKLIQTLAKIRTIKPQFIDKPDLFHNSVSKELSSRVKKHFAKAFEGTSKVKDLRAIYALICFTNFNKITTNKKIDRDVYFSKILGHSADDITTCGSYVDFYTND
jgi:Telomere resolvase